MTHLRERESEGTALSSISLPVVVAEDPRWILQVKARTARFVTSSSRSMPALRTNHIIYYSKVWLIFCRYMPYPLERTLEVTFP
jgi:hypothetical protein